MKDLTIDEFIGSGIQQISHVLQEAATGNEIYRVKTWNSGSFVIMSGDEYNIHHDALRFLLQNAEAIPEELLEKLKRDTK